MAFKMKGSPYAMGTHKTKNTALYAKKKTERELGKTTTTHTKKSSIYDKDKFAKSKGSEGSIGWSKKYSYEPGGGRSGEGVTAEKVTKGGGKTVQYKDKGKTKVITKKGEAPKVKTKKSGKQYSKAIDKIKKKSGHTERHSGLYQKEHNNPDPDREFLKGLTGEKPKYKAYKRTVTHKRPIEKAMKEATSYEGFKKEGKTKKDFTEKLEKKKPSKFKGGVKIMEAKKKEGKILKKAKKAEKKKTGKISTKTMELE